MRSSTTRPSASTKADGTPFVQALADAGIIPGIKVDLGAKDLAGHPGETRHRGPGRLAPRAWPIRRDGARFAKWRAVIDAGEGTPSRGCIDANAQALARYAALCQEAGLVPVVEPEVLMAATHTWRAAREVTEEVLRAVFANCARQWVVLEALVLKPNMVLPGFDLPQQDASDDVVDATLACLLPACPPPSRASPSCRAAGAPNWLPPG